MILAVERLTKTYGTKTLFEDITFYIEENDKIGIVGVNGTGKSTLLKAVAGLESADSGAVRTAKGLGISYLAQQPIFAAEQTVLAEVFRGGHPLMQALRAYELALLESRCMPEDAACQKELLACSQRVDALGGWQLESDAKAILTQLGLADYAARCGALSGGQQKRLALASALVQPADLLILDEPTNQLDSAAIAWLEAYLAHCRLPLLLVTHDRYFLDRVATRILELDRGGVYNYEGNYSRFLEGKALRLEKEAAGERKRQNLLRTELAWMRRGAQARSTKQKARIERFEALQEQRGPGAQEKLEIGLRGSRLGRTIIELEAVSYRVGERVLLRDFSYVLLRRDRVGILGPNGAGKSTLLELLAGRKAPSGGSIKIGQTVKIGYFSQQIEAMDERLRAIEYVREAAHFIEMEDGTKCSAAQLMEQFLFPAELQWTPVGKLSGGERRRLYLLRVLMGAPNVLLLDEPTNDLDLETLGVLEDFIERFAGAVVLVSHDRFFVDRLVDKVFVFEGDGALRQYGGGYSDYQAALARRTAQSCPAERPAVKAEARVKLPGGKKKFSFQEQREYGEIEQVIAGVEHELKAVRAQMQAAGADFAALQELTREEARLDESLSALLERWAYLEEIAGEA